MTRWILQYNPFGLLERFFFSSWWIVLFFLLCLIFYEKGEGRREELLRKLEARALELENEKRAAVTLNEELRLSIRSQEDPNFIELTLINVLGVVPEGQVKVYFQSDD